MPFRNRFGLVSVTVDAYNDREASAFHLTRSGVDKALHKFHAAMPNLQHSGFANYCIVNENRFLEIEFEMGKDIFKSQPINLLAKTIFIEQ